MALTRLRYSTVAFAVLLTQITNVLTALVQARPEVAEALEYGLGLTLSAQGVMCLVFVIVALLGVRLGVRSDVL
jgi:hypothetical protein